MTLVSDASIYVIMFIFVKAQKYILIVSTLDDSRARRYKNAFKKLNTTHSTGNITVILFISTKLALFDLANISYTFYCDL